MKTQSTHTACLLLAILIAGLGTAAAQQINSFTAIARVDNLHGGRFIQKIVEMKGTGGDPQPEEWELIVYDPSSEYLLREFWVGDVRATNEGINYDYYPKREPAGFINLMRLKIGSADAFGVLNKAADKAKIGFDRIDYHLRCREFSDEPIWTLTARNADGYRVGRVDLSAETGKVLRTVWSYRDGRRAQIKDSALLKRPEPLDLRDDREPHLRVREGVVGPDRRKEPEVPDPVDPLDGDPGTEVPEVEPIEPEDVPVPDEP